MKKSLVALAALAVVGAASAQSSVTIYGTLDVGYGARTANGVDSKFQQQSSGSTSTTGSTSNSTSKIGFRGTEDLGGGLKANFGLETGGLDLETGSNALNFSRASWVGVSGGFGDIKLGRITSKATAAMAQFDLNGTAGVSALNTVGVSAVTWYGSSRRSSQFQYTLPVGGFGLHLAHTLDTDGAVGDNGRTTLGFTYANGPIAAAFVAESAQTNAVGARTAAAIGGSYDFGVAKASLTFNQRESEVLGQGFSLGVVAPIGAANVGIQYARNNGGSLPATAVQNATELFANYALSKRTSVYIDTMFGSDTVGGANKAYNIGVIHQF
jgi:predicted porin